MTKKYTLPKEFGEKWVQALRSGEYKQTTNNLFKNGCYCCLGVACKVVGMSDKDISEYQSIPSSFEEIPPILFGNTDGKITGDLVWMNDGDNKSFPKIADWLEQNVEFTESEVQSA